jgi:hypothetical protein
MATPSSTDTSIWLESSKDNVELTRRASCEFHIWAGRGLIAKPTCSRGGFSNIRGGITGGACALTSGTSAITDSSTAERTASTISDCCEPTKRCWFKALPTKSLASRLPRTKRASSSINSPTFSKLGRSAPLAILVRPVWLFWPVERERTVDWPPLD